MSPESLQKFCLAWKELGDVGLVAGRMGWTKVEVYRRSCYLRSKGVPIPKGKCGPRKRVLPIDELKGIFEEKQTIAPAKSKESRNGAGRKKPHWGGAVPPSLGPIFPALWARSLDFRAHELRKPVTQLSGDQALKELAGWGPDRACKAIEHTIARGWQGIREPEPVRNGWKSEKEEDLDRQFERARKELGR